MTKWRLIENVHPETLSLGMACDLIRWNPGEEVYELTIAGDAWLREWCQQKLEEFTKSGRNGSGAESAE